MKKAISLLVSVMMIITMLVPFTATAAPFVSSPSADGGVDVITQQYGGGNYPGLIMDGFDWDDVLEGVEEDNIIITPYQDIDEAHEDVDKDAFLKAKDEIDAAGNDLSKLNGDIGSDAKVKDLFDVTVTGDYVDQIQQGNALKVTFNVGNVDGELKAMVRGANGWEVVEHIKDNGDGTVTLLLGTTGPVAFIVEPAEGSGTTSPATSNNAELAFSLVAVCGLALLAMTLTSTKKAVKE